MLKISIAKEIYPIPNSKPTTLRVAFNSLLIISLCILYIPYNNNVDIGYTVIAIIAINTKNITKNPNNPIRTTEIISSTINFSLFIKDRILIIPSSVFL